MTKEEINVLLKSLPENEQEVLKMRFGLDDGYSLTLDEIKLYFDTTRERIKQIEEKAKIRLIECMKKEFGRDPTDDEIAEKFKDIEGKELTDEDLANKLEIFKKPFVEK